MYLNKVLDSYDLKNLTIGVIGSHSALEILDGAKDEGFKTICICQRGRELPYQRFKRLSDGIMILDSFSDLVSDEIQEKLIKMNTVLIPHRSFVVYLGTKNIEEQIRIPIFGNKFILKAEDRHLPRNQYYLLKEADILLPKLYRSPSEIDGPAIVKIQDAKRQLERAFFIVTSYEDYKRKSETRINSGLVDKQELENKSTIEQFLIGTYFNFNYFYSPITEKVDFLGIERRLQSNIHDYTTAVPAVNQLDINIDLQNVEVGHTPASIRESLLDKVFKMGDKFAKTCLKEYPPGIIGPYSLQCVVTVDLDIVVYDVSLRVPGNPILATTSPYTKYQYGQTFGVGRRIAMELKSALNEKVKFSTLFT